jgi:pimeloyl-ACP methyl ester carboxylesterase
MRGRYRLALVAFAMALGGVASAAAPDYADAKSWAAQPGSEGAAMSVPTGATPAAKRAPVDVFYVHPTTFRGQSWNADLTEETRADGPNVALMARQAGAFNACCRIFAPWYRQASFRAFTDRATGGEAAYDLAYSDVLRAFDHYMAHDNHGRPFILVGHSQGALHVLQLLRERIDGRPAAKKMVAAYVVGIGISEGDFGTTLPTLRPCRSATQTGCVLSWASFLQGAETKSYVTRNEAKFRAQHATGDPSLLCVNPLTFEADKPAAPATANRGTLPVGDVLTPPIAGGLVGARCEGGVLLVTPPPTALKLDPIPGGGNMHYHDIALFYAAIRDNAVVRSRAFGR